MEISKSKTSLAYAKVCRDKAPHAFQMTCLDSQGNRHSDKKLNICDDVISSLPGQEVDYISQLLTKQLRKTNKSSQVQDSKQHAQAFQDISNAHFCRTPTPKPQKKYAETIQIPMTCNQKVVEAKGRSSADEQTSIKRGRLEIQTRVGFEKGTEIKHEQQFISSLDEYLKNLTRHPSHTSEPQERKTQVKSSQFHLRTEEEYQRGLESYDSSVDTVKYHIVLGQFQKMTSQNKRLQDLLEQKDWKIQQMSKVIAQMCCQMESIKRVLRKQSEKITENESYYDTALSNFSKMKSADKICNFMPQHVKRYSHTPQTDDFSRQFLVNRPELKNLFQQQGEFAYVAKVGKGNSGKSKEQGCSLKRKKKPPSKNAPIQQKEYRKYL